MALRIYFAGSIRAGRADAVLYHRIVQILQKYGTVLTEHVGDPNMDESGDSHISDKEIHDRDMQWLESSNVLVAEVTQPSLGVGYEIGRAVDMNKDILCLFRPETGKRLSAMIRGAEPTIRVKDYKVEEIEQILHDYFNTK
jgi:hypothetical protein